MAIIQIICIILKNIVIMPLNLIYKLHIIMNVGRLALFGRVLLPNPDPAHLNKVGLVGCNIALGKF